MEVKRFITDVSIKIDGTNKLIRKGQKCLIATNKPFWKYSEDVPDGIKTRAQEKK